MEITAENTQGQLVWGNHKDNFVNRPTCRLINPTKSKLGRVSKKILQSINKTVWDKIKLNQWQNTGEVIDRFDALSKKCSVVDFYRYQFLSRFSWELLILLVNLLQSVIKIMKSFYLAVVEQNRFGDLFCSTTAKCGKRQTIHLSMWVWAATMEVCEIVNLYILHHSRSKFSNKNVGLYRDDGLAAFLIWARELQIK